MKIVLLLILSWSAVLAAPPPDANIDEWWKTAVFYQIYPRSFKDDDNDGSGDLKGITKKLHYLKDTGITATWLSPIFSSPMVDAGYDISDYRNINNLFGTMADFDALLNEAKSLGLKLILDFVPNHSSDEHEWFKKSVNKEDPYTDYYVWEDGKLLDDGTRAPPNNWQSLFLGSAWEWNDARQQYYLHQFAIKQPDLNYRNPDLVNEMKDILRFWLDKGINGFRIDAVPFLFEDTKLLDEPKIDPSKPDSEVEYADLIHQYTMDQNETFDMIYQWRAVVDEYSKRDGISRVMMTEAYTDIENTIKYYGNATHNGANFPFNFALLTDLNQDSNANDFIKAINKWLNHMPPGYTPNWVFGNHDNHRTATRHGVGRIDGLNMLLMTMPGVGVTYNGEEFGMEDGFVSWEQTEDPNACNAGEDDYLKYTRDPERTPFQWDDSTNAGFNEGKTPWLPVSDKYMETNVKSQANITGSHYTIYQELMDLRKLDILREGSYQLEALNDDVLLLTRELNNEKYILLFNLASQGTSVPLEKLNIANEKVTIQLASNGSVHKKGNQIDIGEINLHANEGIILHSIRQ